MMKLRHQTISFVSFLIPTILSPLGFWLILMCWGLLIFLPISAWGEPSSSPVITVTTEHDVFDGDTHSPETLQQFPGRDGAISFREAIETANQSPEQVTIVFDSPKETMTLIINSPLPPIQESLIIDGTAPHSLQVELRGTNTASTLRVDGLILAANGSIIRGLTIINFSGNGIVIQGHHNKLENNYIGTDALGIPKKGNGLHGILIMGNDNQIGGSSIQARNIISGNGGHGITIQKGVKNRIIGNLIGGHPTRDSALPNAKDGIMITAAHNVIGGTSLSEANIISGNGKNGIHLIYSAHHTRIQGNIVGIHQSLRHPLPNREDGIFIKSQDNVIGGIQPGTGNIIGGNLQSGIEIHSGNHNRIQGNFIGTDSKGQTNWGNRLEGIAIYADDTLVGGEQAGASNRIAFNKRGGVAIPIGDGNTIRGNSIHQNLGLAINLQQDSLTPNDPLDADRGPNGLQNFPVMTLATARSANDLFISGLFQSQPKQTYQLDFYASKPGAPLRYQEAYTYLGSASVKTNATGENQFSIHLATSADPGLYVTATATNTKGNTSELAHSILVERPNPQLIWDGENRPAIDHTVFETSYTEGMAPVSLLPANTKIVDADSPQLTSLKVSLSNLLDEENEVIAVNLSSQTLSQSYTHGTLSITGKAPLALYEEALHSLTYQNHSAAPTAAPRLLTMVMSDGEFTSQPFTIRLTVNGLNTPPTLTWQTASSAGASTTYKASFTEGHAPVPLLPDTVTLSDVDSPQLTQLTVTLNGLLDGDQEIIQATLTDSVLTQSFTDGVLTISGPASVETYQSTLRSLTYENRSPTPATIPRKVTVVASDETLSSQPLTTEVLVHSVNTAPLLSWPHLEPGNQPLYTTTYTEGTAPSLLIPKTARLSDIDSTQLTQLTATITNLLDDDQEVLDVNFTDASLTHTFSNGVLTISGRASISTYQTALHSLAYHNRSPAATSTPRKITVVVSDGAVTSLPHTTQVSLVTHNTPPSIAFSPSDPEALPAFREGGSSLSFVPPDLHIQDIDSPEFAELKVMLNNHANTGQEILSAQLSHAALTQRYTQGTLTITGKASKAAYESTLQSVTYINNQMPLQEGTRKLMITVQDSQGSVSPPQIVQIAIKARPIVVPTFAQPFIASLDSAAEIVEAEVQKQREEKQLVVKAVTGSGLMVTAGIFIWVLRGTSILASLLATIPAWNSIDPLPILGMSQEDRWKHFTDTQEAEDQEQQEFPQFQQIFTDQRTPTSFPKKDSTPS